MNDCNDCNDRRIGVVLAFVCALLLTTTLILLKGVLTTVPAFTVVTFVYGTASLWHLAYLGMRWKTHAITRRTLLLGAVIGVLDGGYNLALLSGLALLGSAVHGFLALLGDLLAVVLGVVILRERYTRAEALAGVVVLGGILVIRAHADGGTERGFLWMIAGAIFFATSAIVSRRWATHAAPADLALARAAAVTVVFGTIGAARGIDVPPPRALAVIAVIALFGPFLGGLVFFHALRRIGVGPLVTIRMTYALFVPVVAWLVFAKAPSLRELGGGALVLGGSLAMARLRAARTKADAEGARREKTKAPTFETNAEAS